ncbi:ELWxxDGT repeat protein [Archangium lipolyticum]|uniref:ELWxxDGT repeat protein n=1 Tax=Archangium lipolyticum TaxID=2970465 RepID=UPI002149D604|nr:ELWxxDGT repeat protein [Archangium lipolyticum]
MSRKGLLWLASGCALWCACGPLDESIEADPSSEITEQLGAESNWRNEARCQPPVMIGDLTPAPGHTNVLDQAEVDGAVFISTINVSVGTYALWKLEDVSRGREPAEWRTTLLLGDLSESPRFLTAVGRKLFFIVDDGVHGEELWKSDGTPGGTVLVEDINPLGDAFLASSPRPVVVGRTLYFAANDGVHGEELWRSDGTAGGTRMVKDIARGAASSSPGPFLVAGHRLLFAADDGVHGRELWKSDGTRDDTRLVKDIARGPASSSPDSLLRMDNGRVFFVADDGVHGRELWKTDGTRDDTRLVEDIRPGPEGSSIAELTVARRTLFFTADDGVHGVELWASRGCADDTRLVEDIRPGAEGSLPLELTALDGNVILTADDGTHGREPWRSDGSPEGTLLLADTHPGSPPPGFEVGSLVAAGEKVFFYAHAPDTGKELWVTDGSPAGTRLVKDIWPGPASSISGDPFLPFPVRGGVFFQAFTDVHGVEPWWSDGTEEGTEMADIAPGAASSSPFAFIATREWLFFTADDGVHGTEPWALPVACFPRR